MTTTQAIGLSFAAFIAYSLFRKKTALGSLNFYADRVQKIEFDGFTPIMTVGILAQNTSNQDFVINSMSGNLYANNFLVGNVSQFSPITVSKNSETVLFIKIRLSLLGIVNDIIRAFSTNNISQELDLKLFSNIDNLQIQIPLKYHVGY